MPRDLFITGIRQSIGQKLDAPLPDWAGEHIWGFALIYRANNPGLPQFLDSETLLTARGWRCIFCDLQWSSTAPRICRGSKY